MKQIKIAGWIVAVDAERTGTTYESIAMAGWEACGCLYCQNFGAVVIQSFPQEVLSFFQQAGIDPLKDAEVYHFCESSQGVHSYGGEYYFWGSVEKAPKDESLITPTFQIMFTAPTGLEQPEFRGDGAVCFQFYAELPWVLSESAS